MQQKKRAEGILQKGPEMADPNKSGDTVERAQTQSPTLEFINLTQIFSLPGGGLKMEDTASYLCSLESNMNLGSAERNISLQL